MSQSPRSHSNRRSYFRFLVNSKFQLRHAFWLVAVALGLAAITLSFIFKTVNENYTVLVDLSPMTDEAKAQLHNELNRLAMNLGLETLLFVVVVFVVGLIISHRTAGPLYHMKRVFEEIANGNHSARIHLRPGDDFRDVADSFNKMMDSKTG